LLEVKNHNLSEAKRNLIQKYLSGSFSQKGRATRPITPRAIGAVVPPSLSQEQLLLRETSRPQMPSLYNECFTLRIPGCLDVAKLQESITEIIRRHEIWRTTFEIVNGSFVQVVQLPPKEIPLQTIDLCGLGEERTEEEVLRIAGELTQPGFDLSRGPLMRIKLLRIAAEEHRLLMAAHLSIIDGMSVYKLFPSELAQLYAAFCAGAPSPLPELPVQYGDYALWQRSWLSDEEVSRQIAYWSKQLGGSLPMLRWPSDRPRPPVFTHRGDMQRFRLGPELSDSIKELRRSEGVTLFSVLLAGFACLLYSYTSQADLAIGTPSPAGRKRSEVQRLLGYFLNPVVIRIDLADDPSARELFRRVQNRTAEAIAYDDVPIEVVAKRLQLEMALSCSSLFTVAISLQPESTGDTGWRVTSMDASSGGAVWDLYLAFIDDKDEIIGRAQYNPDLFDGETIRDAIQDLRTILDRIVADPELKVSSLPHTVKQSSDPMKRVSSGNESNYTAG